MTKRWQQLALLFIGFLAMLALVVGCAGQPPAPIQVPIVQRKVDMSKVKTVDDVTKVLEMLKLHITCRQDDKECLDTIEKAKSVLD